MFKFVSSEMLAVQRNHLLPLRPEALTGKTTNMGPQMLEV